MHYGISGISAECERLDVALTREPFSLSRREAKRLLAEGRVTIEGRAVSVSSRPVSSGARISIIDLDAPLTILDKRDDLIVVDKPPGIPTQPSKLHETPSLLEIVAARLKSSGEDPSLFVVQRLDTTTSGVIVFARSSKAAAELNRTMAGGESRKLYRAIVHGALERDITIDAPIERESETKFRVGPSGRPAKTAVRPLQSNDRASLVEAELFTGRTHQIRVHLAHAGHPLVGDRKYGGEPVAPRPMLHAWKLSLGKIGEWRVEPPEDFATVLATFDLAAG